MPRRADFFLMLTWHGKNAISIKRFYLSIQFQALVIFGGNCINALWMFHIPSRFTQNFYYILKIFTKIKTCLHLLAAYVSIS